MAHSVMRAMYPRMAFDPVADFAPVVLLGVIPMVLLANKDLPAHTLPEMLALIRANPGKYSYGSGGNGSATHLITELLLKRAGGLKAEHVPYRGAAPAMLDLVAGRIALFMDVANTGIGFHQRGEARALAVSSAQRIPQAPDIPTFTEAGVTGADSYTWHMVLAPAGTPAATLQAANTAFNRVVALPHVQGRLSELAIQVRTDSTPESSTDWLCQEVAKWTAVIRDAGIKTE
jgi:tripartite-type tricarboxylate transporter receptor subunit TctC